MTNTKLSQNQLVRALVFEPKVPSLPMPNMPNGKGPMGGHTSGGLSSMEKTELKILIQNRDRIQARIFRIPKEESLF